jgi:hypothetical protein
MDDGWVGEVVLVDETGTTRFLAVHAPSKTPPRDVRLPHPRGEFVYLLSGEKDIEGRFIYRTQTTLWIRTNVLTESQKPCEES